MIFMTFAMNTIPSKGPSHPWHLLILNLYLHTPFHVTYNSLTVHTIFQHACDTKMCSVQFSGRQCMCTHLGQILCNYEFSCIHIVVASF